MDPKVGDWYDLQANYGSRKAEEDAKKLSERVEFFNPGNNFRSGRIDVSRLLAGIHDYAPTSPANMGKAHSGLMIWKYAMETLRDQGLNDPMAYTRGPIDDKGGKETERRAQKRFQAAICKQFCKMSTLSAGGFIRPGHLVEVKKGVQETTSTDDLVLKDEREGKFYLVVASDLYGLYGLNVVKSSKIKQDQLAKADEIVFELTVPSRVMLDPIKAQIDDVWLWKYIPVATNQGFFFVLDQAQVISVRKWSITEWASPRSVLSRIGAAFDKLPPRQKQSAGEYAKTLFNVTPEEAAIIDTNYADKQKKYGDDFTAEQFFVPPEKVGFRHEWLTEEWLKEMGGCWDASERAEAEKEAERVFRCLDPKRNKGENKNKWVRLNPLESHSYIYLYKDIAHSKIHSMVWNNHKSSFACRSFGYGGPISEREAEGQAKNWRDERKAEFGYIHGQPPAVEGKVKEKKEKAEKEERKTESQQKSKEKSRTKEPSVATKTDTKRGKDTETDPGGEGDTGDAHKDQPEKSATLETDLDEPKWDSERLEERLLRKRGVKNGEWW